MKARQKTKSRFGYVIDRTSNSIVGKLVSFIFRRIHFDNESLTNLEKYQNTGKIVYASFHSSVTSLLILRNALRKNGYATPSFAYDVEPYFFQRCQFWFMSLIQTISNLFGKEKNEYHPDYDILHSILKDNEQVLLSLLSLKVFITRYVDRGPDFLQLIVEAQKKIEEPVIILPQIIFWNRNPEKTKTLYSRRIAGDRGLLRGFFSSFFSTARPFIKIARPINVQEELKRHYSDDSRHLAGILRTKLLEIYNNEKRTVIGPVLKTRQEMMEKVLYHQNVISAIEHMVSLSGSREKSLKKKAVQYYKEIAADFSISYIQIFDKIVGFILKRVFKSIEYRLDQLNRIREYSHQWPLVFVPAYKSQMDYLLISRILFKEAIVPPHIVAGTNLTVFPLKSILRKCGALFVRDSFKNNELYSTVFRQYIKSLINEGYNIEFYIEGARSRSGKLTTPRFGVLKYLLEAIEEGYNTNLIFIPVAISYDRIIEEQSAEKSNSESVLSIFKNNKLLKKKFGNVFISFEDPVNYRTVISKSDFNDTTVEQLGYLIAEKINQGVVVTPRTLISMAILVSSSKGFSIALLMNSLKHLLLYIEFMKIKTSSNLKNTAPLIKDIVNSYCEDNIIKVINLEPGDYQHKNENIYVTVKEKRVSINYYKNTIAHYFAPLAYLCTILLNNKTIVLSKHDLTVSFGFLVQLFEAEYLIPARLCDDTMLSHLLAYLENLGVISGNPDTIQLSGSYTVLYTFAGIIQDILESYYIVVRSLSECAKRLSRKEMIYEIRKKGITMLHLGEMVLHEALSFTNYNNAVNHYIKTGHIIEPGDKQKKQIYDIDTQYFIGETSRLEGFVRTLVARE